MKRKGVKIILFITLIAVVFYGYRYVSIPVKTTTAKLSQIEEVVSADAYVVRNESVSFSDKSGTLYNYVTEGARVSKNMLVSTIYSGTVDEELIRELNNIDIKIENLENVIKQNENFTKDTSSLENKIENLKNNIIASAVTNDLSKIQEYKDSINFMLGGATNDELNEINVLKDKKWQIEQQLSGDKYDVYSAISGVFSTNVDGYEEILTPSTVTEFNVADFMAINEQNSDERVSNDVNAGDGVCKVVDNHNWYVLTVLTKEKAVELKNRNNVLIRFDDLPGDEVSASVIYVSAEDEGEQNAVVVLKSDRYLEGVYSMRKGTMDIVSNRYIGYEVPIYAIRAQDGKNGVMKAIGSSEIFCECDIIYKDEEKGTVIIEPSDEAKNSLEIGDAIVLGEKVEE